jgi:L-aminopeptidase/D-esterase-like protein
MKGGIGTCCLQAGALKAAALVAVNAGGDIIDPRSGRIVAGARTADGKSLANTMESIKKTPLARWPGAGANSTIGVIATNAAFTKAGMTKIAQMGHDGLARTINPVHTEMDGDTLFALCTGEVKDASLSLAGSLAAEAVARAVVRAALQAVGIPGYPAASELGL